MNEDGSWTVTDRDLVHATAKHKNRSGIVTGIFDKTGTYWRTQSDLGPVRFTPTRGFVSTGSARNMYYEEFRQRFC